MNEGMDNTMAGAVAELAMIFYRVDLRHMPYSEFKKIRRNRVNFVVKETIGQDRSIEFEALEK